MESLKTELLTYIRRNDLMSAALMIGRVQDANFNIDPYVEQLLGVAAQAWNRCAGCRGNTLMMLERVNQSLYEDLGIVGKHEKAKQVIDDPTRHYLHQVLEKKVGSPLAITILYAILCEQIGIEFDCFALPYYYVLRVRDRSHEYYVDPYDYGRIMSQEEFQRKFKSALNKNRMLHTSLFERLQTPQLIARLALQMKHIYILKGSAAQALRAADILTGLYPEAPEYLRDRGILYCEMEYFTKAISDLKTYLKRRPNAHDVGEIKKLTTMLRGHREVVN